MFWGYKCKKSTVFEVDKASSKRDALISGKYCFHTAILSIRGALPKRCDFDPRAVKTILSDLFTLECDDKGFLELTQKAFIARLGQRDQKSSFDSLTVLFHIPTNTGHCFHAQQAGKLQHRNDWAMAASHFKGSIALFPFLSDQKATQALVADVVPYRNKKSCPMAGSNLIPFPFKNRKFCSSLFGCFDLRGSTLLIAQSHQFIGD